MMKFRRHFSLLETVIAIAILSMSLGVLFQLAASARKRIAKSVEDWNTTHRLMEAAEYVLLHNESLEAVPARFFPYDDCRVQIEWEDMEDIHEEYTMGSVAGQSELKACTISLIRTSDGRTLDSLTIDRILYDDALAEDEN